ncbi:MAG: HD domain-containing protein [Christensenellales bacterium]
MKDMQCRLEAFDSIPMRTQQQIHFLIEIDRMKNILRHTLLIDGSRRENDAEHSWHLALMALILFEYAPAETIDVCKVIKMALVHDLVEVYAGDTFAYDENANLDKDLREAEAAGRLFSLLPSDQCLELRGLWEEFDAEETLEAIFAASLDRLQPLIHNYLTKGHTWKEGDINKAKVLKRMDMIKRGAPALWCFVEAILQDSIQKGYLPE